MTSGLVLGVAACCCCVAVGGGYVAYQQTQLSQPPSGTTTRTSPVSPASAAVFDEPPNGSTPPGVDSTPTLAGGSGPLASRALPAVSGDWTIRGSVVLGYVTRQIQKHPEVSPALKSAADGLYCLQTTGFADGNAYVTRDLTQAGVTVALAIPQQWGSAELLGLAKCVVRVVSGGGPTTNGFDPCFDAWAVTLPLGDGEAPQRFWIVTAGTNQAWCDTMSGLYGPYGAQPL